MRNLILFLFITPFILTSCNNEEINEPYSGVKIIDFHPKKASKRDTVTLIIDLDGQKGLSVFSTKIDYIDVTPIGTDLKASDSLKFIVPYELSDSANTQYVQVIYFDSASSKYYKRGYEMNLSLTKTPFSISLKEAHINDTAYIYMHNPNKNLSGYRLSYKKDAIGQEKSKVPFYVDHNKLGFAFANKSQIKYEPLKLRLSHIYEVLWEEDSALTFVDGYNVLRGRQETFCPTNAFGIDVEWLPVHPHEGYEFFLGDKSIRPYFSAPEKIGLRRVYFMISNNELPGEYEIKITYNDNNLKNLSNRKIHIENGTFDFNPKTISKGQNIKLSTSHGTERDEFRMNMINLETNDTIKKSIKRIWPSPPVYDIEISEQPGTYRIEILYKNFYNEDYGLIPVTSNILTAQ